MRHKLLFLTILFFIPLIGTSETTRAKDEPTVIICTGKYSKRYHNSNCKGMKSCKGEVKRVQLSEAKKAGKTACGYCYK